MERDERLRTKLYSVFNMGYKKLFNYLVLIGMGGLGLFNSSKLEIRYETNSNLELLCQNGMIISAVAIIYFTLAFFVELPKITLLVEIVAILFVILGSIKVAFSLSRGS